MHQQQPSPPCCLQSALICFIDICESISIAKALAQARGGVGLGVSRWVAAGNASYSGGCWQCFIHITYIIYHMISGDVHRPGRLGSRPGWAAVVFVTISWLLSRAPLLRCWCVHVRHSCSLHTLPLAPTDC